MNDHRPIPIGDGQQNPAYGRRRPTCRGRGRCRGAAPAFYPFCFWELPLAEICPFRGIRYNEARYSDLSSVISPPYDVISPAEYQQLRDRSPQNVVRLILGENYGSGRSGEETYDDSAALLDRWLDDQTLVQDTQPAIYLLDQTFEIEGQRHMRRALIARLRLEVFGEGNVFPHEQTMPGPKADRLALMKQTRMNMSQVFGLYPGSEQAAATLDKMSKGEPVAEGTGVDGVHNALRAVFDRDLIDDLAASLSDRQVIIADGHHRYETAIAYRDAMRRHSGECGSDAPWEFVAVALVSMDDPGLVIQPTHRLVHEVPNFAPTDWFERAKENFQIAELPADADIIMDRLEKLAARHAFGVVTEKGARIMIRNSGQRGATGRPEDLDTHILHHEIFGGLLGMGPDSWQKGGPIEYVQSAEDCVQTALSGQAQLAALVNPTRMDEVRAIAVAGGTMPPKSTFFAPKFPAGIVFTPLT